MAFSDIIETIKEAFRSFLDKVKGIIDKIVAKIVDFTKHIVNWFKSLNLIKGRHIPFITNKKEFVKMLHNAPVYDTGGKIFSGVYDEHTGDIIAAREVEAEELDEKTEEALQGEELAVLA